jgi:glutamate-5-semialdehyde dehydrogenase
MSEVVRLAERAREAAKALAITSTAQRNAALSAMARSLVDRTPEIETANAQDLEAARAKGTASGLLDRLELNAERLAAIASAIDDVVALPDPIGQVLKGSTLPNGLELRQVRVPIGVVAMIYEARPNVTADAAALCVKTGNAVILRGGSLAAKSNMAMTRVLADACESSGLPLASVQTIEDVSHEAATELMTLTGMIDVLIPRGGAKLIRSVVENARVPVIETGIGNCHVYVHESADVDMATRIIVNAKCQRPAVCNAAESLLVDAAIYESALPVILRALESQGVTVYGDERTMSLDAISAIEPATEDDWHAEYYDLKIACKVVDGLGAAIAHINEYGTGHSEAIITEDYFAAQRFLAEVDASAVYVNASTRFTDGGEFGLGAEIGISTQKLHARGPMGLEALTSTKWHVLGSGQIRE